MRMIAGTLIEVSFKVGLFLVGCFLFARYLERPMTRLFDHLHAGEGTMLVMLGFGIIVAALAGLSGLSTAIGAFFAGLIFSRDPHTTEYMSAFRPLHDLLAPFFFVGIGLHLAPEVVVTVGGSVLFLLAAAIGAYVPARSLLGSSGAWAVPVSLFSQVVLVSAVTVLTIPLVLRPLLARLSLSPP